MAGQPSRTYGPHERIHLTAKEGQCLEACTGTKPRWGLMIHGGDLNKSGALRPTHGCIRVTDDAMKEILALVGDGTFEVEVAEL